MRASHLILGLCALPLCTLSAYDSGAAQSQTRTPQANDPRYYPNTNELPPQKNGTQQNSQDEENIADRRSNEFDYNLYDRQQNRFDQQNRTEQLQQQQQQYFYQQPAGSNNSNGGTQYNRTRAPKSQYFNPVDE